MRGPVLSAGGIGDGRGNAAAVHMSFSQPNTLIQESV